MCIWYTINRNTTLLCMLNFLSIKEKAFLLKVSYIQNEFTKSSFLPKYEQEIVRISVLCIEGRNLDNFLFVFWEKRWLHKFILKLTDYYWIGTYFSNYILTPSASLASPGIIFSAAIDCRTLGVPYKVAKQLEADDM